MSLKQGLTLTDLRKQLTNLKYKKDLRNNLQILQNS